MGKALPQEGTRRQMTTADLFRIAELYRLVDSHGNDISVILKRHILGKLRLRERMVLVELVDTRPYYKKFYITFRNTRYYVKKNTIP